MWGSQWSPIQGNPWLASVALCPAHVRQKADSEVDASPFQMEETFNMEVFQTRTLCWKLPMRDYTLQLYTCLTDRERMQGRKKKIPECAESLQT